MTISLKHAKTSAKSDGGDSTKVLPTDWNAEHALHQATGKLLGRTTSGDGDTEEIAIDASLSMDAQELAVNLANSNSWTGAQGFAKATLTSSSAHVAWDMSVGQVAYHTLTENTTLDAPSNAVAGFVYILVLKQHASAAKTLAFNGAYKWPGGTVPTLSSAVGYVDVMTVVYDGSQYNCVYQNGVR